MFSKKIFSKTSKSLISAILVTTTSLLILVSHISKNKEFSGVSALSKIIIFFGQNEITCLTISLPIDPAAPETKTILPFILSEINFKFN